MTSPDIFVLSMAKLWKGGAATAVALCRHLSPFGMCTSVRNDRLGSLPTRDRKLSREHGPAASETSHRPRRRIVLSRRAPASNWQRVNQSGGAFFSVLPEIQVSSFFRRVSSAALLVLDVHSCARRALASNWTPARTLQKSRRGLRLVRGSPLCAGGETRPLLLAQQRILI